MSILFFYLLFFVLTADGLMVFLTSVIVYQLTGSIEYSGLSYALWWLPRIFIIPLIGRYIDKIGVRALSIFSDVVKVMGCLFLICVDFSSNIMVAVSFGIVGSIISIGNSQTIIAYEKIIALISDAKEHHVNIMSRMDFLAMIAGPLVGMALLDYGYKYVLALPCLLYISNAFFFYVKKEALRAEENDVHSHCTADERVNSDALSLKRLVLFIFTTPIIVSAVLLAVGNNMFDGLVESSGAALIHREMSLPIKYFGMIDVAAGVCGVIGTYLYGYIKRAFDRRVLLGLSVTLITVSSSVLIFNQSSFLFFVGCYAVSIIGKVFSGNIGRMIRIEVIPSHVLASTSSLIMLLNQSILPLVGMLLYFSTGSTILVYALMGVSILITLASGCLLIIYSKRHYEHQRAKENSVSKPA
ncbi:MFS transporter [Nissabacter archeti]|uniref:MFS transporter n=1 Tax=Nissabacter archeti TaxID=1917880 RepID=UPI000932B566|nr:MFS transporter [Nissabacter archeti]